MESLMAICDRVIAEMEHKAAVPVTQEAQPRPAVSPSRTEPVQVGTVPTSEPVPVRDHPAEIRCAIGKLIAHAERWGDTVVVNQIRNHPERWDDIRDEDGALVIEGYGRQFLGMVNDMTDAYPHAVTRIPEQAARCVCLWIQHRDLELLPYAEYRRGLDQAWAALRKGC